MFLFKKNFFLILILLLTTNVFCQNELQITNPKIPTSIYTSFNKLIDINSSFNLQERLNLKTFNFVYIDFKTFENGYYSIPIQSFKKVSYKSLMETYNDIYHQQNLRKSFFKVSNLYQIQRK